MNRVKLNIGAGKSYIPGFINIDISSKADIQLDLNYDKMPFEDNSVDIVFSYHTLEHIKNYIFIISEIYRVLKHEGWFLVGLPYVTLTEYNLVNPYHYHNFNEYSFDFFSDKKLKGSAAETNSINFHKVFHKFNYIGIFHLIPYPFRHFCRRHLFNVVRSIDFGLIAIKDKRKKIYNVNKNRIIKEYNLFLNKRIPYEILKNKEYNFFLKMLRKIKHYWIGR